MKNYIERTNALLKRRDDYLAAQKVRRAKIIKISSVACSFVAVCLIGVGIWQSDLLKPKDTGSDLPEGFVQVQPNDYTPEQSQPKPDINTQIKEPDLSSPEDKPAVKPDNNTDTEIKQPDVSLEEITPPIVGDMTQSSIPAINYNPLEFEIDDDFSPYEVVVTLTVEESLKNNVYTSDSFKQVDAFYVYRYDSYYSQVYYPQLLRNTTIFLMINEPSKKRVLEYCEILKKDDRVLFATPNPYDYAVYDGENCAFEVTFTDDVSSTFPISKTEFANVGEFLAGAGDVRFTDDLSQISGFDQVVFKFKGTGYDFIKEKLLLIAKNPKVHQVRPMLAIGSHSIRLELTEERMYNSKEFDASEFPRVDIKEIKSIYLNDEERYSSELTIVLNLKQYDHKTVSNSLRLLEKNPIIKEVLAITRPSYEISNDTYKSQYSTNSASYYNGYFH